MNLGGSVVTCSVYMYYKVSANELKVVSLRSVVMQKRMDTLLIDHVVRIFVDSFKYINRTEYSIESQMV